MERRGLPNGTFRIIEEHSEDRVGYQEEKKGG